MKAFSLIELLVVIAIMALLLVLAVPAMSGIMGGSNLTRGGQAIGDQIVLARQEAVAKNREVEVRLINIASTLDPMNHGYRAIQIWQTTETSTNPISRVVKLPEGIVISSATQLSPLLTADGSVMNTANFSGIGTCAYTGFRIRANGQLSSTVTGSNNFLTIASAKDAGAPPLNYYTVRVNPVTGRVAIYRP